ncbi:hypothetical protein IMZ48_07705 [Candidatus Bathyarchaeota archaeon]|nr:hypothetical protein [Candidatus Bathyarchaeota archaeon]
MSPSQTFAQTSWHSSLTSRAPRATTPPLSSALSTESASTGDKGGRSEARLRRRLRTGSSGWSVAEWTPYAWRHSLMCLAVSIKAGTDSSETTTWADAMALRSFRRQTWSSWTDSTPGTWMFS